MAALILFLFSLTLLSSMVLYRVWELREGRFNRKEVVARELTISPAHVEHWNNKFFDALRQFAHFLMVLIVRATIGILFIIRKEAKRLSTRLDQFFLNGAHAQKGHVSFYLKDISDYKETLKAAVADEEKKE